VESEEDAGQESQKVKLMFCKIVKRLTVILSGEYSNKPSVKLRIHKLFVAFPSNTLQYVYISEPLASQSNHFEIKIDVKNLERCI
jgi:hypothetical protein